MKDKIFDFLLSATVAAIVTLIVVLQEVALGGVGILAITCVGPVAGIIVGIMKMIILSKFDKWSLLASVLGSVAIYGATALGVLFGILSL